MNDSPSRWKSNGLPRKGWAIDDVVDMELADYECEWCGTNIRYVHYLIHLEDNLKTSCGCICAEHLTQDYVNPRKKENELKLFVKRKKRKYQTYIKSFKTSKKGNLYNKELGQLVVIMEKDDHYQLKIGEIFGKKKYSDVYDAAKAAFDYLINK